MRQLKVNLTKEEILQFYDEQAVVIVKEIIPPMTIAVEETDTGKICAMGMIYPALDFNVFLLAFLVSDNKLPAYTTIRAMLELIKFAEVLVTQTDKTGVLLTLQPPDMCRLTKFTGHVSNHPVTPSIKILQPSNTQ